MNRIRTALYILLAIALILSSFYIYKGFESGSNEKITSSGILERVNSISELNTVEMYFNEIIDYKDARLFHNVQIPFTQKSFIFTVKAKVKAGIEITGLTEDDIVINNTNISMTLPAPVITSAEILEYKAYDEKDGLFNEVKNEDTFKALDQFRKDLEKQALDSGILDKAKENATASLTGLFKSLGFESIEIRFE